MEQQPKSKHTSTIIFFIILVSGIAAFVLIYFFGDNIKSALSQEGRPAQETATTETPAYYEPDPVWDEPQAEQPTLPMVTAPPATQPPADTRPPAANPPATQPAAPVGNNVSKAFPGASVKETWADNQWILTVSVGWSVTIPAGWIANTDPNRWEISPYPAGYGGADGERLYPGTFMRAKVGGDIYVRYVG